ncbi:GNAT family N-acetyltransferase [Streptomyces sp. NPDC050418]|uniref:GNAT family N-acetyltransferase n=1 Tax=Streptomyces sp. NPDC050418 TaxID=3365612 RepID=UPI00378F20DA
MDLHIREMGFDDIEAVAEIRVRGWQFAYRGMMPQEYLDALSVEEDVSARREQWGEHRPRLVRLVVERAGRVIGFAGFGPARDEDLAEGAREVFAIYVRPEEIATGAGRALMTEALDRCRAAGAPVVSLWVLEQNARARRFYERAGFCADGTSAGFDVDGVSVPEVRYVRRLD